jgi:hypothetical protein
LRLGDGKSNDLLSRNDFRSDFLFHPSRSGVDDRRQSDLDGQEASGQSTTFKL